MKKIINFYYRHRTLCTLFLTAVIVTFAYSKYGIAFAAGEADSADTIDIMKSIADGFDKVLQYASALLWPVILMTGSLLDNDLIFGGAMGERLLSVWVQIRNLVNVVFVLILLAIAVYNVLGLGEEGGLPLAFKSILPKFVIALIAVNFSFLGVKVVLDFTNVIAGAVFALPVTAVADDSASVRTNAQELICGTNSQQVPFKNIWCNENKQFNDKAANLFSRLDRSNITLIYAIRFGKAINLKFVRDGLSSIGQLGFNIIFNAVLYVVYGVSFIVLFIVLLFRLVVLWVSVVLSPLIAVGIVLPNLKELAGGDKDFKTEFINNAIVPIKIGLVLSVGYIMLAGLEADKSIHGELLSANSLSAIDPNAIPTDINDLQQLLIAVGSVVIIWSGVFSAAKKSAAEGIVGTIEGAVKGFGSKMAKLPTYAQVIPIAGKEGKPQSLRQLFGTAMSPIDRMMQKGAYRPSDERNLLKDAVERGNIGDFASQIARTPGALRRSEEIDLLRKIAEQKDRATAAELRKRGNSPQELAAALWTSKGPLATQIKEGLQAKDQADLAHKISTGVAPTEGGGDSKPPHTPVKNVADAKQQLAGDTDAASLGEDPWMQQRKINADLIDRFRKEITDAAERNKILNDVIKNNTVTDLGEKLTKVLDQRRAPSVIAQAATGGAAVPAAAAAAAPPAAPAGPPPPAAPPPAGGGGTGGTPPPAATP